MEPTGRRREQEAKTRRRIDEKWWRRRESNPRPKARRRRTLHACPLLVSRTQREETAKNRWIPDSVSLTSERRAAVRKPACLMAFGPQPPGEAGANVTAYLIKQRERTDCPQLTDVPSDLRVNGARHAFRDSIPPSKPERPLACSNADRACVNLFYHPVVAHPNVGTCLPMGLSVPPTLYSNRWGG